MQHDPRSWLWDVQAGAADIGVFVAGIDLETYASSELIHSAVERKFEIIGEALNQLAKANPELARQIPDLPQIVGFRNQLIHRYAQVDHSTVWEVIRESLPQVKRAVDDLLVQLTTHPAERL